MMFDKILVALDDSDLASQAYDEAVTLAQKTGAGLMLLHVLSLFDDGYPEYPGMFDPRLPDSYLFEQALSAYRQRWSDYSDRHLERLQSLAARAGELGIPTEYSVNTGNPNRTICEVASSWKADLIVVGRHGRKGLSELVMGSTSNYVFHHAPCSVLIVQGIKKAAEEARPLAAANSN